MADNQEEVLYQFNGDVSSLRQATESAIGLLGSYQAQIDRISADGGFGKSAKAAKSFQSQVNATTKQIVSMQKQMKSISDVKLSPSSQITQELQSGLSSINQIYDKLSSSSQLSTKEVQALVTQLRNAKTSLKDNAIEVSALVQKEQQWQQTLDNVRAKTTQFRSNIDAMRGKISSAFDPMLSKLNSLSAPFAKITARMQSFRDKTADTFGKVSQLASTVAAAFRRVSSAESGAADATNKSTNAHSRLQNALASIQAAFKRETTSIESEKTALKTKDDTLKSATNSHHSLRSILVSLGRSFSSETSSVRGFSNSLKGLNSTSKLLRGTLHKLISVPISQWFTEATKQSINYIENLNLFKVAMGESLEQGTEFVNQMAEVYGMDPSNLMRYAGNFYQLSDAIDMPAESAAKLSLSLVKATNDISSLFNVPIEDVFNDLSSGMQGMSRAVRKYGMDIRVTTLQQTALSLGITENVESMSEANRQGLRYITMMRQASNAAGDFAKNIESPANQLKIFKEQLGVLGRSIGSIFIGPLTTAISYINGLIMALSSAISFIAAFIGIINSLFGGGRSRGGSSSGGSSSSGSSSATSKAADGVANSIGGIGSAAGGAAKQLKKMLAPFDELNVLQTQMIGGGGGGGGGADLELLDPAIAAEIEEMELQLENIRMKAAQVRDAILDFLGFRHVDGEILSWNADVFEANLIKKFPEWTQTIRAVFDNWTAIIEAFKHTFMALAGVVQAVWDKVLGILGIFINDDSVSTFISELAGKLEAFATFLETNQSSVANFVLIIGALAGAFKVFGTISTLIAPIVQFVSTCSEAFAAFGSVVGWVAAIVAAIAVLYATSDNFANSFNNLLGSVVGGLGDIFAALWESLQGMWEGIKRLWTKSLLPMLTSIGDALAPVIDTVTALWEDMVVIIVDAFKLVEQVWNNSLEPVLEDFFDAISGLAEIFETLWSDVVDPVAQSIGDAIQKLWTSSLSPVFKNVIGIIGGVIEIVMTLWNGVFSPLISWLVTAFAPIFGNVFSSILTTVTSIINNILGIIDGLVQALRGVIDFIAGVFTGDWSRAWQGVVNVFGGIWNTIVSTVSAVLNGVIGVINAVLAAISGAINGVINTINKISFTTPRWVPLIGGRTVSPNIKNVPNWQIPALASGGIVPSGQIFVARENGIPELVGNFGGTTGVMNNQQIVEAVSAGVYNAVVSAMGSSDGSQETVVEVDGEKLFRIMVGRNRRAIVRTGVNPMGG